MKFCEVPNTDTKGKGGTHGYRNEHMDTGREFISSFAGNALQSENTNIKK